MKNSLITLRRQAGWSQEKFAELLGISHQTVISIEKGRFNPFLSLVFTIAKTFNRKVEDIFTPDDA